MKQFITDGTLCINEFIGIIFIIIITVLFVNATIAFSENLFLVIVAGYQPQGVSICLSCCPAVC